MAKKSPKPTDLNQRMKAVVDEATEQSEGDGSFFTVESWPVPTLIDVEAQQSLRTKLARLQG